MLDTIFQPVYSSTAELTASVYFICSLASLVLGAIIAWAAGFKSRQSKGFLLSVMLIPVIVQLVIMLVSDSVGAGIGERVLITTGSSARLALQNTNTPVDAVVVGIIDE